MWWFIYCVLLLFLCCCPGLHVGNSCGTVGEGVGGWSWIIQFFFFWVLISFSSFCRVNVSLPVSLLFVSVCYLSPPLPPPLSILLFSESQAALLWLHDVRGGKTDSSSEQSLDQERAGNNLLFPSCSVLYCLPLTVTLPSLLHLASLCHHPLIFVSLSPLQIPTLWGRTALTMPWSEEWWP